MPLSPKLKEQLPQFNIEHLGEMDRNAVARRGNAALALCLENISQFPFRDGGKVETRKVTIEINLTPELKETKVAVELPGGRQQEVKHFELAGVTARVKIKSALPDAETGDVRMACDIHNGKIKEARFNPENNEAPDQLELDLDDEDPNER